MLRHQVKLLIIVCDTRASVAREVIEELSPGPVVDVIGAGARSEIEVTRNRLHCLRVQGKNLP